MRFRSDPARIRGSIAPVVSPFTADGLPDLESLRGLVRLTEAGQATALALLRAGAPVLEGPVAKVAL
jgi:hypothetical protein